MEVAPGPRQRRGPKGVDAAHMIVEGRLFFLALLCQHCNNIDARSVCTRVCVLKSCKLTTHNSNSLFLFELVLRTKAVQIARALISRADKASI